MTNLATTIIIAIIGSNAVFSFLQFIVQRADNKKGVETQMNKLEEKIEGLNDKFEEHKAVLARTHILRFADEQKQLVKQESSHSEEYFKQQILDIDTYDKYCEKHPEFSNGLTVMASQYIKAEYKRVYLDGN